MERVVQPEWLDNLRPDDPEAQQSRRDLCRVNRLMGHARVMAFQLRTLFPEKPPRRLIELGSGDGLFSLALAQRLSPRWPNVEIVLVDRANLLSNKTNNEFQQLGWSVQSRTIDVFAFLESAEKADCIFANLFLHHFEPVQLRSMFRRCAVLSTHLTACEPRRSAFAARAAQALGWIGCNRVTQHDAVVSVQAGFHGDELSALWPDPDGWVCIEQPRGLFSHAFTACRRRARAEPDSNPVVTRG